MDESTPQVKKSAEQDDETIEPESQSYAERLMHWMAYKSDHHKYLTNILSEHKELYNKPHTLHMYSEGYKSVNRASKDFCGEIARLQWDYHQHILNETNPSQAKRMQEDPFQRLANLQNMSQECVADSLNLYLDSVASLGQHYSSCKNACLEENPVLKQDIADRLEAQKTGQRQKIFDSMSSDPCLQECRRQFYFVFKRVNKYLTEDNGLYIESCHKFDIQ